MRDEDGDGSNSFDDAPDSVSAAPETRQSSELPSELISDGTTDGSPRSFQSMDQFLPDRGLIENRYTVQLLVVDEGNRAAIRRMLSNHFDVLTDRSVGAADGYVVEDRLIPRCRDALREQKAATDPAFLPVVMIRRDDAVATPDWPPTTDERRPALIDDVVDVPVDPTQLVQRLRSLLIRRQQSQALRAHVETVEEREQALRRFERGVEATGNGIAMTAPDGTIEYVNPGFVAMTGYDGSTAIGRTPQLLVPTGHTETFDDRFWRTMADRTAWDGEVVIERQGGTRRVVDARVTTIQDGDEIEGFVIVLTDVTERIQRERELQSREHELELLRQVLTRYLRHNLRNDLNVIIGYAGLLAEASERSTDQIDQAEMASIVLETANQLLEKSETARAYSTLLERTSDLSSYDLTTIVGDVVNAVGTRYPDVEFDIDLPESCPILARDGIRTAITELVENAAKHNDASDPQVTLRIRTADDVSLTVTDNGPGISADELTALTRGDETPLSHSQGIGLWLCKWVIEGVDGRLDIERRDSGTRVRISFPTPEQVGADGLDVPTRLERERRLETIISRITDAIVEVDDGWQVTFLDERAGRILGVDPDDAEGRDFWTVFTGSAPDADGVAPEADAGTVEVDASDIDADPTNFDSGKADSGDFSSFERVARSVMESRTTANVEAYHPFLDRWLTMYVYPEFGGGLSFYLRDVTDRRSREQALERARARMELALTVSDAIVWEWDCERDVITTHPQEETLFTGSLATIDSFFGAIHPDDRDRVRAALDETVESGIPYDAEYRIQTGDSVRWIHGYGERMRTTDDTTLLVGIARNVTDEMDRKLALEERVKELTAIHDSMRVFNDPDETIEDQLASFVSVVVNSLQYPAFAAARVECGDLTASTAVETLADAMFDPPTDSAADQPVIEGQASLTDGRTITVTAWYQELPTTASDDPFLEEERTLLTTLATIAGVGVEREATVQELRESQERLELALEAGQMGSWELDLRSTDSPVRSPQHDRIFGYEEPLKDWSFETFLEHVHPDDRESVTETFEAAFETGSWQFECRIIRTDDEIRWIAAEGLFEFDAHNTPKRAVGIVEDITDRRTHQADLELANKRLDRVASMAAHDLRNPLSVAIGNLERYRDTGDEDRLAAVDASLERLSELITDITTLARLERLSVDRTQVRVDDVARTAWSQLETGTASLETEPVTVACDQGQVRTLLENLIRNSIEHGTIGAEDDDTPFIVRIGALPNGFFVEDTGRGIQPNCRDAIFDHGFSTKAEGRGVGLTIVERVASAHDWTATVTESAEGGARFEFRDGDGV